MSRNETGKISREVYEKCRDDVILHDEDEWGGKYRTYGEMWAGEDIEIELEHPRIVNRYTTIPECRRVKVTNRRDATIRQIYGSVISITEEIEGGNRYAVLHHESGETSTFPTADWRIQVETFIDLW